MKGYIYILECSDGSYYTGSTIDLERRLEQHQNGEGANYTAKRLPVKLIYYEEYDRIDQAFYREKQVQGWSRKKKEALMNGDFGTSTTLSDHSHQRGVVSTMLSDQSHNDITYNDLRKAAECMNETHYKNFKKEGNGG